eukprot:gene28021-49794_t
MHSITSAAHQRQQECLMTKETNKCPFDHTKAAAPKGRGNADWWPDQLNIRPLNQNSPLTDPMGDGFDYAKEFKSLDLAAVKADLHALVASCRVAARRIDEMCERFGDEVFERRDEAGGHGILAVLAGGGGDALAGGDDCGVVKLARFADPMAEIARTEKQCVEARNGGDVLDVFERFGRFDLENYDALGVAVTDV